MRIEAIVNKPATHQAVALNELLSLPQLTPQISHNHTHQTKIDQKADFLPITDGKNIYLLSMISDPQEFYRELSKNGFTLVDSRVIQDAKVKKD